MALRQLGGNSTLPTVISDVNQNLLELMNREVTTVYKDSTGTPTIIIGILPDGTTGIVIAKSGIDVRTVF